MSGADERTATIVKNVRSRAAAWLVERRASDNWSNSAQADLEAWLAESPSHAVEFLRLEAAWNRTERLAALRRPHRGVFATGARLGSIFIRIAAGLGVVAVAGSGAELLLRGPSTQTYATALGGHETERLSDGSVVELNTDTVLRIAVSGSGRRVWLDKGEAFFQVVHDRSRPFVVTAGDHRVIDLGTKFVVRREMNAVEVTLVDGRARLENTSGTSERSAVLVPGDVAVATAQSLAVKRQKPESMASMLSWRRGMLMFHHATLAEATAEFNRYNSEKMAIGDTYAAGLTFNGTLPTNDIAAFVRVTQKTFGLHVARRGEEIIISR